MKTINLKQKGHQGDVQFRTITQLPTNAKKIENTPLAYGEHSGHIHVLTGDVELFETEQGNRYAVIGGKGALIQHVHENRFKLLNYADLKPMQHEDHMPIELQPNQVVEFGIHKKYDPFKKVWEKVID